MAEKKSNEIRLVGVGVGTASLLVIFVVLGMTVLALLSLSVARSDQRILARINRGINDYYEAQIPASEMLGVIDDVLMEERNGAADDAAYYQASAPQLLALGCEEIGENAFSFRTPIDDGREMEIGFRLLPINNEEGRRFQIIHEKTVVTAEWNPDTNMDVWIP